LERERKTKQKKNQESHSIKPVVGNRASGKLRHLLLDFPKECSDFPECSHETR